MHEHYSACTKAKQPASTKRVYLFETNTVMDVDYKDVSVAHHYKMVSFEEWDNIMNSIAANGQRLIKNGERYWRYNASAGIWFFCHRGKLLEVTDLDY